MTSTLLVALSFQFPSQSSTSNAHSSTIPIPTLGLDKPFPSALVFSSDFKVDHLIADIPFFCIGLVAVTFFVFLLALRRVDQYCIYIFASAIAGFIASSADLSFLLSSNPLSMFGVLVVREMGLAAAVGLRLIFLGRTSTPVASSNKGKEGDGEGDGEAATPTPAYMGAIVRGLEISAILTALVVLVAQMIWRLARLFTDRGLYGSYRVAAFAELGTLVLVIIRLAIGMWTCGNVIGCRHLVWYIPMGLAITLNFGTTIANLSIARFTESALGRFLQALEIESILFALLLARARPGGSTTEEVATRPSLQDHQRTTSSFRALRLPSLRSFRTLGLTRGPSPHFPPLEGIFPRPFSIHRSSSQRPTRWFSLSSEGKESRDSLGPSRTDLLKDLEPKAGTVAEKAFARQVLVVSEPREPASSGSKMEPSHSWRSRTNSTAEPQPLSRLSSNGGGQVLETSIRPASSLLGSPDSGIKVLMEAFRGRDATSPISATGSADSDPAVAASQESLVPSNMEDRAAEDSRWKGRGALAKLGSPLSTRRLSKGGRPPPETSYNLSFIASTGKRSSASVRSDITLSQFPEPPTIIGPAETQRRIGAGGSGEVSPDTPQRLTIDRRERMPQLLSVSQPQTPVRIDVNGVEFTMDVPKTPTSHSVTQSASSAELETAIIAGPRLDVTSFINGLSRPPVTDSAEILRNADPSLQPKPNEAGPSSSSRGQMSRSESLLVLERRRRELTRRVAEALPVTPRPTVPGAR